MEGNDQMRAVAIAEAKQDIRAVSADMDQVKSGLKNADQTFENYKTGQASILNTMAKYGTETRTIADATKEECKKIGVEAKESITK